MIKALTKTFLASALCALPLLGQAGPEDFRPGELIPKWGKITTVPLTHPIPKDTVHKLAIDVAEGGTVGEINKLFVTAASFLNMQHSVGIPEENVHIALVVHGMARKDILNDKAYGGSNPNTEILAELQKHNVKVYYCGMSAVYNDVAPEDLLPGVEITLSASTTHSMLQQDGYALRP